MSTELRDALAQLRYVVPYFWNDDNPRIGELDDACAKADAALAAPVSPPAGDTPVRDDEETQPYYDLAWKHGARGCTNFDGDELTSIEFCPNEFENFCAEIAAAPAAPAQHIQRAGATVYELNSSGVNRWDARVQPGRTDEGERTTDAECEAVAASICAALAAAPVAEPAWQPISTAPAEGMLVISGGTYRTEYSPHQHPSIEPVIAYRADGGFLASEGDQEHWHEPTHWLRLPPLPASHLPTPEVAPK